MLDQRQSPAIDGDTTERDDIIGLRGLLFKEIRSLEKKATKEQIEIAKVKAELAQTIINSVKIEVIYLQSKAKSGSNFIPLEKKD